CLTTRERHRHAEPEGQVGKESRPKLDDHFRADGSDGIDLRRSPQGRGRALSVAPGTADVDEEIPGNPIDAYGKQPESTLDQGNREAVFGGRAEYAIAPLRARFVATDRIPDRAAKEGWLVGKYRSAAGRP